MNAGGGHTGDGLRRTASSLVVALGKERVRAQRAGQCCHCASIQLLPGLQGRRGTPWEAVSATNTLAPAPPMHNHKERSATASKTRLRDDVYVIDLDDGRMKTRPSAAMCYRREIHAIFR